MPLVPFRSDRAPLERAYRIIITSLRMTDVLCFSGYMKRSCDNIRVIADVFVTRIVPGPLT